MNKLTMSEDHLSVEEALAKAISTENEREIVRGFSPAQHALGRAPDEFGRFLGSDLQDVPQVHVRIPMVSFGGTLSI